MELVFCGLRKHSQLSSMDWMVVGYYAVLLPAAKGKYVVGWTELDLISPSTEGNVYQRKAM